MDYEIIKFENDSVELEVNVSPEEETVWLTKEQIAVLFNKDRTVISKHINRIYKDGELDINRTCAKNAQVQKEGGRNVTRTIELFNLDVVLSVGYRTSGKRAVVFRKWANSVLKEYLLRGYAINDRRALVTLKNYINLANRVNAMEVDLSRKLDVIEERLSVIEEKQKHLLVEEKIFFENQMFEALVFINQLVETAKESIVLIDPYVDARTLNAFKKKNRQVSLLIITVPNHRLSNIDIKTFVGEHGSLEIKYDYRYHDRFLIIDDFLFYKLGSSLNYLGKRFTKISLEKNARDKEILRERINQVKTGLQCLEDMSKEEFDTMLEKSYDQAMKGEGKEIKDVIDEIRHSIANPNKMTTGELLNLVIIPQIIGLIIKNETLDEDSAYSAFFQSKTYDLLSDEQSGLWRLSPLAIYTILKGEKETGEIIIPNGQ